MIVIIQIPPNMHIQLQPIQHPNIQIHHIAKIINPIILINPNQNPITIPINNGINGTMVVVNIDEVVVDIVVIVDTAIIVVVIADIVITNVIIIVEAEAEAEADTDHTVNHTIIIVEVAIDIIIIQ